MDKTIGPIFEFPKNKPDAGSWIFTSIFEISENKFKAKSLRYLKCNLPEDSWIEKRQREKPDFMDEKGNRLYCKDLPDNFYWQYENEILILDVN